VENMAIYTISDLHLSLGIEEKPMDIFGKHWEDHVQKIAKNWGKNISPEDVVLIAGDFSWATYLEDSLEDFRFLESLPGNKIILKGNHDYWWSTMKKMNEFLEKNEIRSVKLLYNNAIEIEKYVIAGTRYWSVDEDAEDNEKILRRECERAKLSLNDAKKLNNDKPIIFMTHYPPDERMMNCVESFNIKYWIYGHIHSNYEDSIVSIPNMKTYLTSCDYLNFVPLKLED